MNRANNSEIAFEFGSRMHRKITPPHRNMGYTMELVRITDPSYISAELLADLKLS